MVFLKDIKKTFEKMNSWKIRQKNVDFFISGINPPYGRAEILYFGKVKNKYMWLQFISSAIDSLNEKVGKAASWLTILLVALVCYDVAMRSLFNETAAWVMELEWHLFALLFLLGGAYTFKHDAHVRVDLFYSNFSKRDKAWVNLAGGLVFLIPWCILLIYVSFHYGLESFKIREGSPDPGGLPARYIIKFAIAIGFFLLLLQAISSVFKAIIDLQETKRETT